MTHDRSRSRFTVSPDRLLRLAAAVACGLLMAAAFPPFGVSELAWTALVPLLLLCAYTPSRAAFRWGFLAGLVFWLTSIVWLLRLIRAGGPPAIVVVGWAALSAYCALYTGAFAMLASSAIRRAANAAMPHGGPSPREDTPPSASPLPLRGIGVLLVLPLAWIGLEYLRSTLFTGFAWNALGVSQYRNLALIQSAEWGGVYAVSWILAVVNCAVALAALRFAEYVRRRGRNRINAELILGLTLCFVALFAGVKKVRLMRPDPQSTVLRVSAVNPAIAQSLKWDDAFAQTIQDGLADLTEKALLTRPDLVVWPETATPYALRYDPGIQAVVNSLAQRGAPMLVGSMDEEDDGTRVAYYNSAFLVGTNAALVAEYRKRHLVPFGEYIPLDCWIPWISRFSPIGLSCTPGKAPTVFRVAARDGAIAPFAALICFEDTVASLARDSVRGGARLLINLTNDAWFDDSAAEQHLSHSVFRCVENRVPAIRCANLGVTCFIDRTGAIDTMTQQLMRSGGATDGGYRTEQVRLPGDAMPLTLYTRFGDLLFALPCGIAAAVAIGWMTLRRNAQCLRN